jgi:dsDNA-specific endonuclease/ATPase MutS2
MSNENQPQEVPVNGVLDLHTFRPDELGSLIPHYIEACREKDIYQLRIIHGKGTGNLRRSVHALLERNKYVEDYRLAGDRSSWGATLVDLKE